MTGPAAPTEPAKSHETGRLIASIATAHTAWKRKRVGLVSSMPDGKWTDSTTINAANAAARAIGVLTAPLLISRTSGGRTAPSAAPAMTPTVVNARIDCAHGLLEFSLRARWLAKRGQSDTPAE